MIENDLNIKNLVDTLCKVSMCDPLEESALDALNEVAERSGAEKFIVEFGVKKPNILVNVGQHIKLDDIIAYMNGIPVRSKICGVITEITDRYIVGVYETDTDAILASYGLSENMSKTDLLKQFDIKI